MRLRRQRGVSIVEFAVVALLVFIVLFGCIELSRAIYTYNSLTEGTRRAARLAAVCPPCDEAIARAAIFGESSDPAIRFPGLSTANARVEYLSSAGAVISCPQASGRIPDIAFVRVSIQNYALPLHIPLVTPTIPMPAFSTTLPRESLGWNPDTRRRECS